MPTDRKAELFASEVEDWVNISIAKYALENTIEWIGDNVDPDDVFGDDKLREYVAKSSLPEDVFDDKKLSEWAESNGYEKK